LSKDLFRASLPTLFRVHCAQSCVATALNDERNIKWNSYNRYFFKSKRNNTATSLLMKQIK